MDWLMYWYRSTFIENQDWYLSVLVLADMIYQY